MAYSMDITMERIHLGTTILKFKVPLKFVDEINKLYDDNLQDLEPWNNKLVGRIEEEKRIDNFFDTDIKSVFESMFKIYMASNGGPGHDASSYSMRLSRAWINEMRAHEYNPMHCHFGDTDMGLTSVLMLKRPSTYGVEHSNAEKLNGHLHIISGAAETFSHPVETLDLQPGDFCVFPFGLYHGVYPFNGTDEVRRTMSYNCDFEGFKGFFSSANQL